jgi:hypothetical protein
VTKINEIYVELSGNSQRYVNECCESESDGKIDGFVLVVENAGGGCGAVDEIFVVLQLMCV